jgi:hypothetical protein
MAGAFGDFEPEDAWTATDPVDDQIRNLRRRIALVDGMDPPTSGTPLEDLDRIWYRAIAALEFAADRPDRLRIYGILSDNGFVRGRLARSTP